MTTTIHWTTGTVPENASLKIVTVKYGPRSVVAFGFYDPDFMYWRRENGDRIEMPVTAWAPMPEAYTP